MYIVLPLWPHFLWYWGRNDSKLVLWPVKWRLISGWALAQVLRLISPRCPHKETLGPYLPIAKFCGVPPRNVAEFLRELLRSFSAKFRGENPRRNKFLFSSAKKIISCKGCSTAKREIRAFFLGWSDICLYIYIYMTCEAYWNNLCRWYLNT